MGIYEDLLRIQEEEFGLTTAPVPLPRPQVAQTDVAAAMLPRPRPLPTQAPPQPEASPMGLFEELQAMAGEAASGPAVPVQRDSAAAAPAPQATTETAPAATTEDQNAPSRVQQIVEALTPASVGRGASALQANTALARAFWFGDLSEVKRFEKESKDIAAWGFDPEIETARAEWEASEGWLGWDVLKKNPGLIATLMGEAVPSLALPIATGALGGAVGAATGPAAPIAAPGGAIVGSAAGIFLTRMGSDLRDFLKGKDIDPDDPEQIGAAVNDPKILSEARAYMTKKAGSAAAVEAVLGGVVGRFVAPLARGGRTATAVTTTVGGEAVGSGLAGQAGNLAVGEPLSMREFTRDVFLEVVGGGFLEAAPSVLTGDIAPPVREATPDILARTRPQPAPIPDLLPTPAPAPIPRRPDIRIPAPESVPLPPLPERRELPPFPGPTSAPPSAPTPKQPSGPVTPEAAEAEGRTVFAYVDKGKIVLTGTYGEAEAAAGARDTRKGKLIAVRPEELTVPKFSELEAQATNGRFDWTALPVDYHVLWNEARHSGRPAAKQKARAEFEAKISTPQGIRDLVAAGAALSYKGSIEGREVAFRQINYGSVDFDPKHLKKNDTLQASLRQSMVSLKKDLDLNKVPPGALVPDHHRLYDVYRQMASTDEFLRRYVDVANSEQSAVAEFKAAVEDPHFNIAIPQDFDKLRKVLAGGRMKVRAAPELITQDATVLDIDAVRKAAVDRLVAPVTFGRNAARDVQVLNAGGMLNRKGRRAHYTTDTAALSSVPPMAERMALALSLQLKEMINKFNLSLDLHFAFFRSSITSTSSYDLKVGSYCTLLGTGKSRIAIDLDQVERMVATGRISGDLSQALYYVISHEFGHYLSAAGLIRADPAARSAIFAAYRRAIAAVSQAQATPENYAEIAGGDIALRRDSPEYIMSFEEWWAEQVARWMFTNQRPVGIVEKIAKDIAKMVENAFRRLAGLHPINGFQPEPETEHWLNTLYDGTVKSFYSSVLTQELEVETRADNARAVSVFPTDPEYRSVPPLSLQSVPQRRLFNGLGIEKIEAQAQQQGIIGLNLRGLNVAVDRFNRFYKWTLSLPQLTQINDHIAPLNEYTELVRRMAQEQQKLMIKADDIIRRWKDIGTGGLGRGQSDALGAFLFDLTEMTYLTAAERAAGVSRQPTAAEFNALVAQYKLGAPALSLYAEIRDSFVESLDRYIGLLVEQANQISNPTARAARLNDLAITRSRLLSRPYFPMTRYGKWTITVKNAGGKLSHFETFESKREQERAFKQVMARKAPGDRAQMGMLSDEYRGLMGLPSLILDQVTRHVNIPTEIMEQLRYDLSPAQSFRKRFLNRKGVAGYSTDARRNYAHYMFHHSRHFTRARYGEQLQDRITQTKALRSARGTDARKIEGIADFMQNHLNEVMNPAEDWSGLRSAMAIFWLGFSPASAIANLTQTPLVTAPFLGAKFGDAAAMAALTRVSRAWRNLYAKGATSGFSASLTKAMGKASEEGLIDESRAIELASVAEGATVLSMAAGRESLKHWARFASVSMKMFSTAEKLNRLAAFGAAYELAMTQPDNAYVRRMPSKYPLEYADLTGTRGWSPAEATAYLAARDTIYQTQFEYGKHARPRFMRGRASAFTMFYLFTQNMVFAMRFGGASRNVRFFLTMAFMGGLMGLPGMEDANDIIKVLAARFFGKEFDIENEARQFVIDLMGTDDYVDRVMHGASRTGFGLPQLASMMGAQWFPDVDLSGSIGMPNLLPMRLGFLNPGATAERAVYDAVHEAAGPVFGPTFALFNALQGMQTGDLKKWEKAVPRALQGPFRAYRLSQEGFERNSSYQVVTRYDFDDPEQRAEIAAIALGFNTTRSRRDWDFRIADAESQNFWKDRRQIIFDQFWAALQTKHPLGPAREAMVEFNKDVPDKTLVIRPDAVVRSMLQRAKRNAAAERELPQTRSGASTTFRMRETFPDAVEDRPLSKFK